MGNPAPNCKCSICGRPFKSNAAPDVHKFCRPCTSRFGKMFSSDCTNCKHHWHCKQLVKTYPPEPLPCDDPEFQPPPSVPYVYGWGLEAMQEELRT